MYIVQFFQDVWEKLRMKKILPAIAISFVFTALMVSQLLINGQELSASQTEKNKSRYSLFEDQFVKLNDTTASGKTIELRKIKEPIVILNFWASWCKPCLAEFPTLNNLIKKFPKKIMVLGINNDTESAKKQVTKIQQKHSLLFESVLDAEGSYADKFKIMSVPSSIVYHKGKVIKFIKKEFNFMSEEFVSLLEDKIE